MGKVSLPIKTKIAARWMIVISGIIGCLGLLGIIIGFSAGEWGAIFYFPGIGMFIGGLLIFLPSLFLLKEKRWAWWFCIIMLIIELIIIIENTLVRGILLKPSIIYLPILLIVVSFIISFFLLLFDRPNFWKITEKEIKEKKVRGKLRFIKIIPFLLILFLIWQASGFLPSYILNPSPLLYNLALKTKNEFFCFIIPTFSIRKTQDNCYLDLAIEKRDINLCDKVTEIGFCVEEIAKITEDESICERFNWPGCWRELAKAKQDPILCEKINDSEQREICYREVAEIKKDSKLCEKIVNSWERDQCYYHDFFIENDPTICGKISNKDFQKSCYKKIKTLIEDETANWKTYRNEEYGFEIKYPEDWESLEREYLKVEEFRPLDLVGGVDFTPKNKVYPVEALPGAQQYPVTILVNKRSLKEYVYLITEKFAGKIKREVIINNLTFVEFEPTDGTTEFVVEKPKKDGCISIYNNIRAISLTGSISSEEESEFQIIFNQMLSTFRFLE